MFTKVFPNQEIFPKTYPLLTKDWSTTIPKSVLNIYIQRKHQWLIMIINIWDYPNYFKNITSFPLISLPLTKLLYPSLSNFNEFRFWFEYSNNFETELVGYEFEDQHYHENLDKNCVNKNEEERMKQEVREHNTWCRQYLYYIHESICSHLIHQQDTSKLAYNFI